MTQNIVRYSPFGTKLNEAVKLVANSQGQVQMASSTEDYEAGTQLDWNSWLPFCAKSYKISPRVEDYVVFPAIVMLNDIPNRNCVGFGLDELTKWHRDAGMPAYRLWKGQPVHLEHDNGDETKAYGVIVDVSLRKVEGFGTAEKPYYKVILLLAIDKVKHPDIAQRVLDKELTMVSMGAYVSGYICSKCGAELGKCRHLHPRKDKTKDFDFYIDKDGELVFRKVVGITPFECSLVDTGAYPMATIENTRDLGV